MSILASKEFWTASIERAVKTFAQTTVALIGTNAVGILDIDWAQTASAAGLAAVLSVLTSIGSVNLGPNKGPSLVDEQLPASWDES